MFVLAQQHPTVPSLSKLDSQNRSLPATETGAESYKEQFLPGNRDTAASTRSDALPNSVRQETTEEGTVPRTDVPRTDVPRTDVPRMDVPRADVPMKQRDVIAGRASESVDEVRPQAKSNKNLKTSEYGAYFTPLTNTQPTSTPSVAADKPVRQSTSDRAGQSVSPSATGQTEAYVGTNKKNRNRYSEPGTDNVVYERFSPSGRNTGVPAERSASSVQPSTPTDAGTQLTDMGISNGSSEPFASQQGSC